MTTVADIITDHLAKEGPLLPILNDVQSAFGCVDEDAVREIAASLNLTRAEVHGVVSFYHDYRTAPETRPIIKLCGAEACQARGAETLLADAGAVTRVKIETVYCLGLCSVGPAAMIDGNIHARLDTAQFRDLIAGA